MKLNLFFILILFFIKSNFCFSQQYNIAGKNTFYIIKIENKQNTQQFSKIDALYLLQKKNKYKKRLVKKKFFVKNNAKVIYKKIEIPNCSGRESNYLENAFINELIMCCYFADTAFIGKDYDKNKGLLFIPTDTIVMAELKSSIKLDAARESNPFRLDSIKNKIKTKLIDTINDEALYTNLINNHNFLISAFAMENIQTCECLGFGSINLFYISNFERSRKITKEEIKLLNGL